MLDLENVVKQKYTNWVAKRERNSFQSRMM
jgi:hypothetical protein